jgi:aspartate racemase
MSKKKYLIVGVLFWFNVNASNIGIMGGMGPKASIVAQTMIMDKYSENGAKKDQDYPNIMISSESKTPDRTAFLLNPDKNDSPVPYMIKSLKQLERSGADTIFITCNTAYAFIDYLLKAKSKNTTIINMIEETSNSLKKYDHNKILLLASDGTLKTGIYNKYLGNDILQPKLGSNEQKMVMDIIYGKYGIKAGYTAEDPRLPKNKTPWFKLQTVLNSYPKAERIILGCTELPLAVPPSEKYRFIDPVEVVIDKVIKLK